MCVLSFPFAHTYTNRQRHTLNFDEIKGQPKLDCLVASTFAPRKTGHFYSPQVKAYHFSHLMQNRFSFAFSCDSSPLFSFLDIKVNPLDHWLGWRFSSDPLDLHSSHRIEREREREKAHEGRSRWFIPRGHGLCMCGAQLYTLEHTLTWTLVREVSQVESSKSFLSLTRDAFSTFVKCLYKSRSVDWNVSLLSNFSGERKSVVNAVSETQLHRMSGLWVVLRVTWTSKVQVYVRDMWWTQKEAWRVLLAKIRSCRDKVRTSDQWMMFISDTRLKPEWYFFPSV